MEVIFAAAAVTRRYMYYVVGRYVEQRAGQPALQRARPGERGGERARRRTLRNAAANAAASPTRTPARVRVRPQPHSVFTLGKERTG